MAKSSISAVAPPRWLTICWIMVIQPRKVFEAPGVEPVFPKKDQADLEHTIRSRKRIEGCDASCCPRFTGVAGGRRRQKLSLYIRLRNDTVRVR